jgi:hypothetical protein
MKKVIIDLLLTKSVVKNKCSPVPIEWHSANVDSLTMRDIRRHFSVDSNTLSIMIALDPAFPDHRRNLYGERVWRLPDLNEYFDGHRNGYSRIEMLRRGMMA